MSSWLQFFREAGIPSSPAKSYATTFDDNRITKDMLMDLNKEYLKEMGIRVMGDIISILKHAEKVHMQESRKRERSASINASLMKSTSTKLSSMARSTSPAQMAAVSTTSNTTKKVKTAVPVESYTQEIPSAEPVSPGVTYIMHQEDDPDVLIEQLQQPMVVDPATIEYGTLHSDQLLLELQPQDQEQFTYCVEETPFVPATGTAVPLAQIPKELESGQYVEYTTAAYESGRQKRLLSSLYSDHTEGVYEEGCLLSPPKQPRMVLHPGEDSSPEVYSTTVLPSMAKVAGAATTAHRSRRLLENAGLFPSQKEPKERQIDTSSVSVFSRLGRQDAAKTVPALALSHTSPPSSTTTATAVRTKRVAVDISKPRTVKVRRTLSNPQTVVSTSKMHSDSSASKMRSDSSTSRMRSDSSTSRMHSSTSSVTGRLSTTTSKMSSDRMKVVRAKDRLSGTVTSDSSPSQFISKSASSPGRLSSRLSVRANEGIPKTGAVSLVKPVSGSSHVSSRLGVRARDQSTARIKPAASSSSSRLVSRTGVREKQEVRPKSQTKSSMVADEYETKRQLDIRSRLERKEWEIKARRKGPLGNRLAKHHVFGRLE